MHSPSDERYIYNKWVSSFQFHCFGILVVPYIEMECFYFIFRLPAQPFTTWHRARKRTRVILRRILVIDLLQITWTWPIKIIQLIFVAHDHMVQFVFVYVSSLEVNLNEKICLKLNPSILINRIITTEESVCARSRWGRRDGIGTLTDLSQTDDAHIQTLYFFSVAVRYEDRLKFICAGHCNRKMKLAHFDFLRSQPI